MDTFSIDINCDVGEGIGNEKHLLPLISSCNIACGGHAGTQETMTEVIRLARDHKVKVGAHPSYPDKDNFGRVSMHISKSDLIKSIREQIDCFVAILEEEKVQLHHIKPHGALYNDIAKDSSLAMVFLESIKEFKEKCVIYVPYNSVIEHECLNQYFNIKYEAFADRNYNRDYSLVSRSIPNAVLQNPQEVLAHVLKMVKEGEVKTLDGTLIKIKAETFCVHGDTPSSLQILMYLVNQFPNHNIKIKHE